MAKVILIDTNILARFLLRDNPELFSQALKIINQAKNGKVRLYIDELVIAELVWLFSAFYKLDRHQIATKLYKLLSQSWIANPRLSLIIKSLDLFNNSNLSYIDCWLYCLSKAGTLPLQTFDKKLKKLSN